MHEPAVTPIPVTVVGGYLGAGKTTLVNHLLRNANGLRVAVLVNDFGALQIDAELIEAADGDTISLANGCICCSLAGGLVEAMLGILERDRPPEWVVIETSGVSDPVAAAQYAHLPGFRLDGVVVLADAETVRRRSTDRYVGRPVLQQLRGADLVLLNKTDLITGEEQEQVRAWLAEVVPGSRVVETVGAQLPLAVLLGGLGPEREEQACDHPRDDVHVAAHRSWSFIHDKPIDGERFRAVVAALPESVVRAKGVLYLGNDPDVAYAFQLVGSRWSITRSAPWASQVPVTKLVFVGLPAIGTVDDIEQLLQSLQAEPAICPTEEFS